MGVGYVEEFPPNLQDRLVYTCVKWESGEELIPVLNGSRGGGGGFPPNLQDRLINTCVKWESEE